MNPIYIYVLKCPESGAVRYVGKTHSMGARFRNHIYEGRHLKVKSHKTNWINKLIEKGLRPHIEIDVVTDATSWKDVERERIQHYRALGCRLTNTTDGGDGETILSEGQRAALSLRQKTLYADPERRARISERMKQLWADPVYAQKHIASVKSACAGEDYRNSLSQRTKAQMACPEIRSRQSEMMKGKCQDPEWLAQRTEKMKNSHDAEYRVALSIRAKAQWSDPQYRKAMTSKRATLNSDPVFLAKLSAAARLSHSSEAYRKQRSEQMKAIWQARKASKSNIGAES